MTMARRALLRLRSFGGPTSPRLPPSRQVRHRGHPPDQGQDEETADHAIEPIDLHVIRRSLLEERWVQRPVPRMRQPEAACCSGTHARPAKGAALAGVSGSCDLKGVRNPDRARAARIAKYPTVPPPSRSAPRRRQKSRAWTRRRPSLSTPRIRGKSRLKSHSYGIVYI